MSFFTGKVAVVTGAGRGIGAATAKALARLGCDVVICSRTSRELAKVCKESEIELGRRAISFLVGDVSSKIFVQKLFRHVEKKFGRLDFLVNNAGMFKAGSVAKLPYSDWKKIQTTNIDSMFLCSQQAVKLINRGGSIVNVSSLGGIAGTTKFKGTSAYVASKFAVTGFTEALAVEAAELGIRVNAIAPGAVDTKILKQAGLGLKTKTKPEDIAKTIVKLCQSAKFTGRVKPLYTN